MRKQKPDYIRKRTEDREQSTESKKHILFAFILIWLALLPGVCLGAEYYLDANNGDDSYPGTSEEPWKTLSKTQSEVRSGDIIIVRNGSYGAYTEGSVNRTDWITYKAAEGHSPEWSYIFINWNGPASNTYLRFDGITIRAQSGEYAISVRYSKYTQFLNLDVIGLGAKYHGRAFDARYSSNITIDNSTFSGGEKTGRLDGFGHAIYTQDSNNITITNSEITQFHGIGITVTGSNHLIRGNNIHKMGGDGIVFGTTDGLTIENNQIHDLARYEPVLQEVPTETTWSEDGTTMYNPNAAWGVDEPISWEGVVEIVVNSGDNVKVGDKNVTVAEVVSPTEIIFDKSIKDDPNGPSPSNVDYYLRDRAHLDLIQANNSPSSNLTIRGNRLYHMGKGAWSFMHLQLRDSSKPDEIGGHNVVVENNLSWTTYTDGYDMYSTPLNLRHADEPIFRNNIVIGSVLVKYNKNVTLLNNIIGYIGVNSEQGSVESNYNIYNLGSFGEPYSAGPEDTFLNPGIDWDKWNDPAFTGIFADYYNGDFQHASENSLGIGHSDPTNSPATDILGVSRDSEPDAGCYEYVALTFLYGDVNGNGEVTSYDAALVARYAVGLETFTDEQRQKADVTGNGEVSAYDAALIAQRAVGLIDRFPVEE